MTCFSFLPVVAVVVTKMMMAAESPQVIMASNSSLV